MLLKCCKIDLVGKRGKPRRAHGEGTLEYLAKERRWRIRLTINNPDGTTRRKTFTSRVSQEDVINKRDRWKADRLGKGPLADPEKVTLSAYFDRWLATTVKANVAPSTHKRYEQVGSRVREEIGGLTLSDLSVGHVEDFRDGMLAGGLAPDTVRHAVGVLSTALNAAVRRGLLPTNPASDVRRPKAKEEVRALGEEEARRLVRAAREVAPRYAALFLLAVNIGPRQGETLGLRWSDLDRERGTLTIERTAHLRLPSGNGASYGPTKSGKPRAVKLPQRVLVALEEHRRLVFSEMHQAQKGGKGWQDGRLMFPNRRGALTRLSTFQRVFSRILGSAGLDHKEPSVRFHDLRHTAATLMIRQLVPINVVAKTLGHTDPALTLRRYSHVLDEMHAAAAEAMDRLAF